MKLQAISGGRYWFPDNGPPRVERAIAGPFGDRDSGLMWMVEHTEAKLSDQQRLLWADCLELAGGPSADPAHLMAIVGLIARSRSRAFVMRCSLPLQHIPGRSPNYGN